jgi:hypothetical protein
MEKHSQIDHILINKRRCSNIEISYLLEELTLILTTVLLQKLDRLSVSRRAAQNYDTEKCNVKNLNDVEVKGQYQVKISNKCATLKNWDDDDVNINRTWEIIIENMKFQPD